MKQLYKYITVLLLWLLSLTAEAQTYNSGTWYSLYNTTEYSRNTATGGGIHTYNNVFIPNAGTYSFDSRIPGDNSSYSSWESSSSDPKDYDYGVKAYTLNFGNINNITVTPNVSVSASRESRKFPFIGTLYRYKYTYSHNYRTCSGSGLNQEISSIEVYYNYLFSNTLKNVYLKNVKVPMGKHIRLAGETNGVTSISKSFGSLEWGEASAAQTVNFRSFLTNGNITVKLISGDKNVWRLGTTDNISGEITKSRDGYTYAVGSNQFAYNGSGQCSTGTKGNASGYDFVVYFCPQAAQSYSGTITITDGTSTATVTLSGTGLKQTPYIDACPAWSANPIQYGDNLADVTTAGIAKGKQNQVVDGSWSASPASVDAYEATYTITFTPNNTSLYNTKNNGSPITCTLPLDMSRFQKRNQEIQHFALTAGGEFASGTVLGATATSGLTVTYTSSDPAVATVSGTGATAQLNVLQINQTVTITATQAGDANWNAAPDVAYTITTIGARPDNFAGVSATALTYGQTLQESVLSGVVKKGNIEIEGTLAWQTPALKPDAGNSQSFNAVFIPTGTFAETYSPATFTVTLNVSKATPVLTWNIGSNLRAGTTYTTPVSSSNSATPLQVTISAQNNVTATYSNGKLSIGQLTNTEGKGSVTLRISQAGNGNYEPVAAFNKTFSIEPKSQVCLPISTLTEETYGNSVYETRGNVDWCNSDEDNTEPYTFLNVIPARVTYAQHKGIRIGTWLSGTETGGNEKYVILSFNGVPDNISFNAKVEQVKEINPNSDSDFLKWLLTPFNNLVENLTTSIPSNPYWQVQESANGTNWSDIYAKTSTTSFSINQRNLNPDTRYIKISYFGNFAGYITGLRISLRQGFEYGADRNKVTEIDLPAFGEGDKPLQQPQDITFRYYSIGDCSSTDDNIVVENPDMAAFYANKEEILERVGFDQWGEYTLTVRNTTINKSGAIKLIGSNGDELTINTRSAMPAITADNSNDKYFHTGTEQPLQSGTAYRGLTQYDFGPCFSGSTPLFDTLYVFGVSGNTNRVSEKFNSDDNPLLNTPSADIACNAHTPLFVYQKSGNRYVFKRQVNNIAAERLGSLEADGGKTALTGYCPFAYNGTNGTESGFVTYLNNGSHAADLTLINTEIAARPHTADGTTAEAGYAATQQGIETGMNTIGGSGAVISFCNTDATRAFNAAIHSYGTNRLTATRSTDVNVQYEGLQLQGERETAPVAVLPTPANARVNLTIDNLWADTRADNAILELIPSEGMSSVDLGNHRSTLTLNGGVLRLANGADEATPLAAGYRRAVLEKDGLAAILYGYGEEQTDGTVLVQDGTIVSNEPLRMPFYTTVTGGTFYQGTDNLSFTAAGDIYCYETPADILTGLSRRPVNSAGAELNISETAKTLLPADYGKQSAKENNNGKICALLPTAKQRQATFSPWIAAMPENAPTAGTRNGHLLYMEVSETMQTEHGIDGWKPVSSSDGKNYKVSGRPVMLMQVDKADTWRTFVAPFDIRRLYVIELNEDAQLDYGNTTAKRSTAVSDQNNAAKEFIDHLADYITPSGDEHVTSLPLSALLSIHMQANKGNNPGLYPLIHYNGSNFRQSNYYLYETGDTWAVSEGQLQADWRPVTAKADGTQTIMSKGKTYAMDFFYCPACKNRQGYDYWSGKFILLEGAENQTLNGTNVAENLAGDMPHGSYTARLTGNSSLGEVSSTNAYVFDGETDTYKLKQGSTPLRPTESIVLAKLTGPSGAPLRAISRAGQLIYAAEPEEPEQPDNQGNPGITTTLDTPQGGWSVLNTEAGLLLRGEGSTLRVFSTDGRLVWQGTVNGTITLALPRGIYLVDDGNSRIKVVNS